MCCWRKGVKEWAGNPKKSNRGGRESGESGLQGNENKKALRFSSQDASDRIGSPALSSGFNAVPFFFAALFVVGGLFAVSIWRLDERKGFLVGLVIF